MSRRESAADAAETASEIPADAGTSRQRQRAAAVVEPACGSTSVSKETAVGTLTLRDILAQLARPGRDPREDLPPPVFKQGVLKLEDLTPGMELTGTVLNVVDFGCFVDIGMHDSGLVHVSRLADRFIRDPHEVVAVGDIVKVWVMEVDKERRRVSLTMVRPGSERPRRPARGEGGDSRARLSKQARTRQAQDAGGSRIRPVTIGQGAGSMAIVRRAAAKAGRVDDATASRINRAAGPARSAGRQAARWSSARRQTRSRPAGRSMPVLRSKAAGRRAKAAPAASPARIVAAVMAVRRREDRGRKVPVRAALMSSSPSPSRSSRSPMP